MPMRRKERAISPPAHGLAANTQESRAARNYSVTQPNSEHGSERLPAPYYHDENAGITIYHGDCREILPRIVADVVVTDPPYGISDSPNTTPNRQGKRAGMVNTWHPPSTWDTSICPDWCRLCCASAHTVAWFGHWRKREEVCSYMTHPIRAEIVWAKDCHVGPPCPVAPSDERIWLFYRRQFNPRRFEPSVWHEPIIPTWQHRFHRNEKPVSLMRRLVLFLSDTGDTILDPFMGSGTTLRAAKDLGRKAIGIEIEEKYCEIAVKRLAQEVLPL